MDSKTVKLNCLTGSGVKVEYPFELYYLTGQTITRQFQIN